MNTYDVIIVGGGPGGYTAAMYCARAALKTLIVEEIPADHQLFAEEYVENYPGFDDGIEGSELSERIQHGAEKFGAKTLYARVYSLRLDEEPKTVYTTQGNFKCKSVILAMGASPRSLGVPGESRFSGKGLSYDAACDGTSFAGKTVAVIGGGSSAVDDAVFLSPICKKVYLINPESTCKASRPALDALHKAQNILPLYRTVVTQLLSKNDKIVGIEVLDKTNHHRGEITCDGIFVAIGKIPNTKLCRSYLDMNEQGFIIANETTRTNLDGVYATGDLRTKPVRQIITAAADGAVAAMNAEKYVREN